MALFDNFNNLQDQLRGTQTPAVAPGTPPEIASLFAIPAAAKVTNAIAGASNNAATIGIKEQDRFNKDQKAHDKQAAINELQNKQDVIQNDLSAKMRSASLAKAKKAGYDRIVNASGGYDFVDPNGNKITPHDYAVATGNSLPSVLSGSLDPRQANGASDYANYLKIAQTSADFGALPAQYKTQKFLTSTVKKYEKDPKSLTAEEKLVAEYAINAKANPDILGQKPQDFMSAYVKTYPELFDPNHYQSPVTGDAGAFQASSNPYGFLDTLRGGIAALTGNANIAPPIKPPTYLNAGQVNTITGGG